MFWTCKLQKYFYCNRHRVVRHQTRGLARGARPVRVISAAPESAHSVLLGNLMNIMAPCRGGGGVVGAERAAAGGPERGREATVPTRGCGGAVPQRPEVEGAMTGVPDAVLAGEGFAGEGQEAVP